MNGSSALTSMYFALDLEPGSEIMVPSYTFFATCLAMRFFGYVPVFVDIDPMTACFDLEDARRKLTPRTKAVVTMHSWGLPCEMDHIAGWCREKGLILLEDAAHAHGAEMQGKKMGTWGLMGIYSFQATKVLPGIEGGMGMYQTREHYERATAFGHYEAPATFPADSPVRAYEGTGFGQKYRMHPFAAAVLRPQFAGSTRETRWPARNVRALNDRLVQLPGLSEPRCRPDQKRVYYSANMLLPGRAEGRLLARRTGQGTRGRGRAGQRLGLPRTAQAEDLRRGKMVAPPADHPRAHARRRAGESHPPVPAAALRRRSGADRPVRVGIREDLGPPNRAGHTLIQRSAGASLTVKRTPPEDHRCRQGCLWPSGCDRPGR